jgi:hypothetical protein
MTLRKLAFIALANLFVFTSCTDDNDTVNVAPRGDYENGLLISHEGNFSGGVGTVTYVSGDLQTVEDRVYENVNGTTLGNVVQSIAFNGDLAYIIENGSNTIEIVNRYTFISEGSIDAGFSNPRYMAFANGKGYVTNWGDYSNTTDDYVAVIDLENNSVSSTISSSYLPESIISVDNNLYVATGIYGNGDKVDVLNSITDTLDSSITVGTSPNAFQLDSNNDLWVSTNTSIEKIATATNTVETTLTSDASVSFLNYENGTLYYYKDSKVFSVLETATTLPTTALVSDVSFYGMTVKNGNILGVDVKDYVSNGDLLIYNAISGALLNTIEMDIIPSKVYFN